MTIKRKTLVKIIKMLRRRVRRILKKKGDKNKTVKRNKTDVGPKKENI